MILLLLIAAATLPYLRSINGEWLFDDFAILDIEFSERGYLLAGQFPTKLPPRTRLSKTLVEYPSFKRAVICFFQEQRSLTHLGYYWTWRLFKFWRPAWHAGNLVIHAVNTVLLYLLAGHFVSPSLAALAAVAFAVHPHQVTAVSYVSGRAGLQVTFFALCWNLLWTLPNFKAGLVGEFFCLIFAQKSKEDGLLWIIAYAAFFSLLGLICGITR